MIREDNDNMSDKLARVIDLDAIDPFVSDAVMVDAGAGRPFWLFSDGSMIPVVAGGAIAGANPVSHPLGPPVVTGTTITVDTMLQQPTRVTQFLMDITLQRFAEYHNLQGAFGRRAVIEQAKGILMARHAIDQKQAFEMLRTHSQHNGRKLVDVAEAIVDSHLLLLPPLVQSPVGVEGTSPAGAGIPE